MEKLIDGGAQLLDTFGLSPGQNVLFVHAHPDDESVVTGSTIHSLQEAGINVHLLTATDGTASTLGDPVLVQAGWRRIESMMAQLELGIPLQNQHYLGLQDGQLEKLRNQQRLRQAIGQLATELNVAGIFTPGKQGFDGHTDHMAVHNAALQTALTLPNLPAVWGIERFDGGVAVRADPILKLNATRHHATQYPKLAQLAPLTMSREALMTSERHSHLANIDEGLWSYFDLLFFSERWIRYTKLKEEATDETLQHAHA